MIALPSCARRASGRARPRARTILAGSAISIAAALALPSTAFADDASRASDLRDEATSAAKQRDWAKCKAKAAEAWALQKNPITAGLLGACAAELGENAFAAKLLDYALRLDDMEERRAFVKEKLDAVKKKIATVIIESPQGQCEVRADASEPEKAPATIYLEPGSHDIQGHLEGYPDTSVRVDAVAGEQKSVPMKFTAKKQVAVKKRPIWPGIVGLGVGAAGLGVGGGLLAAKGAAVDDAAAKGKDLHCDPANLSAECKSLEDDASSAQVQGNAGVWMLIGGGAVFAAGAGLTIWALTAPKAPKDQAILVLPVVSPTMSGVVMGGKFQ